MTAEIINFARHYAVKADALTAAEPVPDPTAYAVAAKVHSPSLLALPFVTQSSMWNDEPTDKGHVDYARGRQYAREAVAAIVADDASPRSLEMVIAAILDRGFKRRGPGGRLCRQLSSAESAFLYQLARIAIEGARSWSNDTA